MPIRKTSQRQEDPEQTKRIQAAIERQKEENQEKTAQVEAAKEKQKENKGGN
jgi:hypothetical protein